MIPIPSAWPEGSISGLRARGQRTVAIEWENGQLRRALIVTEADSPMVVQVPDDRPYSVISLPRHRHRGVWGAEDFVAIPDLAGELVEALQDGNRLAWTPDPNLVYRILAR